MKTIFVNLGQAIFSGLGLSSLFMGAYYTLNPSITDRIGFAAFILIGLLIGALWFVINGLFVTGFLKRSVQITSNAFDTQITVLFGDLFEQDGFKTISVNEFFDSAVDGRCVVVKTLHGAMLSNYWGGNTSDWDSQVESELEHTLPTDTDIARAKPGKQPKYEIGTTVLASTGENRFLCVVLAKTDTNSLQASATSDDLHHAMRGLLTKARKECGGSPLNIPLLGSGLARTSIKPNIIVHLIMLAIFEESKKEKITGTIRIVLPEDMRNRIDLHAIQRDWS